MNKKRTRKNEPSQRMLRVGELVRKTLSEVFMHGKIDDPALDGKIITVPEVRMTSDLRLAKCYIVPLGGQGDAEVVEALNRHVKYIRGQVAPQLGMKFAPTLKFYVDDTFDAFSRIDSILNSPEVARDLDYDNQDDQEDNKEDDKDLPQ